MDWVVRQKEMYEKGEWSDTCIPDLLVAAAQQVPERTAIVSYKEEAQRVERIPYREFYRMTQLFSKNLYSLGIRRGDIVSVQLPNWWEFAVCAFGVQQVGAVLNGMTTIYRQRELTFILERTRSKMIVIPRMFRGFDYLNMVLDLLPKLPELKYIVVVNSQEPLEQVRMDRHDVTILPFESFLQEGITKEEGDNLRGGADDLAQVAFTSGTTGEPKGVMHTHNTLLATLRNFVRHVGFSEGLVNLVVSPVGHQTGYLWGTLLTCLMQGTAIYLDRWNPDRALQIIEEERVTHMFGAFPFAYDLYSVSLKRNVRPSSLQVLCTPGAPIPRVMVGKCAEQLHCTVLPAWGMTEYGIALAVAPDAPAHSFQTDGSVLPGAEIKVVDHEGKECGPGVEGDLLVRGSGLFIGYFQRLDLTEEHIDKEGWFFTGDRAVYTESGDVCIVGRSKDIIIRGGENIPVAEIENLLYRWEKVKDVAIVAMPDERLGEKACAYIVPQDGTTVSFDEMIEWLSRHGIAKQKLPERLEIIQELPRTATGKVQKFILRMDIANKLQQEKAP